MNFGKFDRQLTLQAPAPLAQDDFGQPVGVPGFTDVATVWGERKPGTGTEAVQADQLTAVQVVVFQIRYRADLKTTWQLVEAATLYQITAVAEIGRRAGLLLTCVSRG